MASRRSKRTRTSTSDSEVHLEATTENKTSQKRCNAQTKSSVRKYVKVLQILTSDQKKIIEDMGFKKLLEFKLTYQSIYLIQFLLDNTNPQTLVICVDGGDKLLPIHQNVVHCVLSVPTGSGDDLPHSDDENSELDKLKAELGLTKNSAILYNMLVDKIKEGGTDEQTIRCFFLVLFSTLLFPGTQIFITECQAAMTRSTNELKTVNWAKVVVDDIRVAVNKWRTRGSTRSSICCTTFLTLYYLDHLHYVHAVPLDKGPRAAFYDDKLVKDIIKADEGPNHAFGKLNFRSMNNSCYSIATGHDSSNMGFDNSQFISQLERSVEGLDENIRTNEEVKKILADARCAYRKAVEADLEHKNNIKAITAQLCAACIGYLNQLVKQLKAAADSSVNNANPSPRSSSLNADGDVSPDADAVMSETGISEEKPYSRVHLKRNCPTRKFTPSTSKRIQ